MIQMKISLTELLKAYSSGDISEDDIELKLEENYVNVFIERYDETFQKTAQYDIPINTLKSQYPYYGSAFIGGKRGNVNQQFQ